MHACATFYLPECVETQKTPAMDRSCGDLLYVKYKMPARLYVTTMDGSPNLPPLCSHCQESIKLIRRVPGLGSLSESLTFYCSPCRQAKTIERSTTAKEVNKAAL